MISLSKRLVVLLIAVAVFANATCFAACVANHCEETRKEVAASCHQPAPEQTSQESKHHDDSDARCQHPSLYSDRDRGPIIAGDPEFVAIVALQPQNLGQELVAIPLDRAVISSPPSVSIQRSSVLRL
jgi:hypothetical protein